MKNSLLKNQGKKTKRKENNKSLKESQENQQKAIIQEKEIIQDMKSHI